MSDLAHLQVGLVAEAQVIDGHVALGVDGLGAAEEVTVGPHGVKGAGHLHAYRAGHME